MKVSPHEYLLSVLNWLLFVGVSMLNLTLGCVLQLLALPMDRARRLCLWVNHWIWGRLLYAVQVSWTLRRSGYDKLGAGPYIVVCNHNSLLDIPANMTLPLPLRVVGKTSLFRIPLMGWYMSFSRQIPLNAEDPASVEAMRQNCRDAIDAGISVLIFPEGTRSQDGHMGPFNRGAFRIAKDLGVPLLPVVVDGTRPILPKGSLFPSQAKEPVTVQVLDVLDPATFSTARKLSNHAREQMTAALAQLRPRQAA